MTHYKILKNIPVSSLPNMIPRSFLAFVALEEIVEDRITLALFSVDRNSVMKSGQAKKLLAETAGLHPLLVIGNVFTREAAALLQKNAEYYFGRDDTFWTDESYERSEIEIASKQRA